MKDNLSNKKTWNLIAESFDKTRKSPWKICIDYINNQKNNITIADFGCGNGRHLIPAALHCKNAIGIDFSEKLLEIVAQKVKDKNLKNVKLIQSNLTNVDLKDNSVDSILYIAALHNIKGRKNRIKSIKEVRRTLKKDGSALISVWSRYQDKFRDKFLFKPNNTGSAELGDIEIYWNQDGLNIPRFYHLYSKKEFLEDLKDSGFKNIKIKSLKISSKKYNDNYFAYVKN